MFLARKEPLAATYARLSCVSVFNVAEDAIYSLSLENQVMVQANTVARNGHELGVGLGFCSEMRIGNLVRKVEHILRNFKPNSQDQTELLFRFRSSVIFA